jgi:DnaJ domain
MDTLYDLLGALPHDDAESLRTAFRRAVKSAHPDLRPGDPDAAIRFRQIVRANEILLDKDQRAVYDHLLVLAQQEKDPAAAHPIAAKIHKIASGVLAFATVSIVTVGGYLLFMHMSVALVAPVGSFAASRASANAIDLTARLSASIAAVSPVDAPDPAAVSAFIAARAEGTAAGLVNAMAMAPAAADAESASPAGTAGSDPAPDTTTAVRARDVSALGGADIGGIMVSPDQVTQLDQKFTAPYVDRGILFFRDQKDEHAFPELAPLKRGEKAGHPKSVVAASGKNRPEALPKTVPLPIPRTVPRTAPRFVAEQPWYASTTFQ